VFIHPNWADTRDFCVYKVVMGDLNNKLMAKISASHPYEKRKSEGQKSLKNGAKPKSHTSRNVKLYVMKNYSFFLILMILIIMGSCTSSQFSTTHRRVKNGHVTYVNKYSNDHLEFHKSHKKTSARNENQVTSKACQVSNDNRVDEIQKVSMLHSTTNTNQFLASTSKEVIPQKFNEIDLSKYIEPSNEQISTPKSFQSQSFSENNKKHPNKYSVSQYRQDTVYVTKQSENKKEKKHVAIGGLVCSIIGLFIAGIILGTIGIISGAVGLSKVKKYPEKYTGKGTAIASLIIGIVAVVGAIVVIALL